MKFFKVLGVVLLILAATAGGAALRLKELLTVDPDNFFEGIRRGEREDAASVDFAPAVPGAQPSPIEQRQGSVNVLVVGLDNVDGASRTDAIALAIFDGDNRSVRVASIPRDSRVDIPGRGWDKINHAYVYGGIDLLRRTLVNLTGMPVDFFVKVNYQSFPRIIDLLGGVDIYVEKNLHYTDYSGKLFINIKKGQQHMDGKTALGYVRFRHDPLGDIGRVQRQQKFMGIVMEKLKSPSILPKIPELAGEMFNAVDTDLTPIEALKLVQFASSLPSDRITMFMAPGSARYSGALSYWILDPVALSLELAAKQPPINAFSPGPASADSSVMTEERLAELRARIGKVRILNGDGQSGLGKRASQIFQKIGIEVPYTGNARHYDYRTTNIIYPPKGGDEARQSALALAELCGIVNPGLVRADGRAESLTLILGHDKETIFSRLESMSS